MENKRRLSIVLIIILAIIVLAGCQPKETTMIDEPKTEDQLVIKEETKDEYGIIVSDNAVSFIDGREEEITISKKPKRVIILFSSFIDIWTRNGGTLIGMVEDSNTTLGNEGVETVGKFGSISLEKVLSLNPDLVILSSNSKAQKELILPLEENNIPIIPLTYEFKDDYFKIAKLFATINDRTDLYEQEAEKVKDEIQVIIDKTPKDNQPKILIMFASSKSLTARGSNSTLGEMFKDLNTINIADNSNDLLDDKNFSLEKIIEEDPDFIFVQTMGSDMDAVEERIKSDAESNPAWASLSAVKNNRYIVLPKDLYMYKANHRYSEAYKGLAEILYPEIFK